ncbi:hypothetical protein LguiA_022700 [Lonicera macranthoides]
MDEMKSLESTLNPLEGEGKKRAVYTPSGFLEFALDFRVKYKNVYPREKSIPKIVLAAADEWELMSPEAKAKFLAMTNENKEYEQAADLYWKTSVVEDDSDSDSL